MDEERSYASYFPADREERDATMDARLWCEVWSIKYSFLDKTGYLHIGQKGCCDMDACIALFESISPEVLEIYTYNYDGSDTAYLKMDGKWVVRGTLP